MIKNHSALLFRAIRQILRPIVRLMIARQITYNDFALLLKEIFVSVADKDFTLEDEQSNDSRLSLLTGIHRKEVKKIRQQLSTDELYTLPNASITAQLIARWQSDPNYIDHKGKASILAPYGLEDHSFEALVRTVSKGNLRVATVLNECLRLGIVSLDDQGNVCLKMEAFVVPEELEEKLYFFERNLVGHLEAACHNIQSAESPFFERSVIYNCIPADKLLIFDKLLADKGMNFLKEANRQAQQHQDKTSDKPLHHMTIGMYYHHVPMDRVKREGDREE